MGKTKTQMPYVNLLPPLSTEEFEALKADIRANGLRHPVCVDEDGNVLDGHHRLKIDPDAERVVITGLSPGEKEAFVFRSNMVRRNLSVSQKDEARRRMRKTAELLRQEDAKKWTQAKVGAALGVAQQTVSVWFTSNTKSGNAGKPPKPAPDARVKVNPKKKPEIKAAVDSGKSQAQVAADFGVSQQAISNIVRSEEKKEVVAKERQEAAKTRKTNCGVIHGDFRTVLAAQDDESIDLIFTDPPYDKKASTIYVDIAKLAASKLTQGGWLVAYTGQFHLPEVIKAFAETPGLEYGWTFCIVHSGGDQRIRKFNVLNGWKPLVAAYRPKLKVDWEWFRDISTGGKEKDSHEWQQAESEAAHFIERLCPQHGLVFDPCCGSGTSLAAAKSLNRKWFGVDIDSDHVETARARLGDA